MNQAQELIATLAVRSRQTAFAGDARQYVDSVINNLDEVDAVLPDSLNRGLIERITLLLERANREAALAVELRQRAEAAEAEAISLRERERWISVEEKLPQQNDEYQVFEPEVGVTTADYRDGEWFTVRSFGVDGEERPLYAVTHWKALSAAPERF